MKFETLASVGEFGLIANLIDKLSSSDAVLVGPGDDAAVVKFDKPVVVSTDVLVENVHFRQDWSSPFQVGRKAIAQNLADMEAMGAVAKALLVGFSAPKNLPVGWAVDLMAGMSKEADNHKAVIVGGDTTTARDITVAITVLGECLTAPVLRSGARPGQVIAYTGRLGLAAGGLLALERGLETPEILVSAHRIPQPPYGQGVVAAHAGASALIDISDGLLADLSHIAEASKVGMNINSAALEIHSDLEKFTAELGIDPLNLVLTGGEDHGLAGCFSPDNIPAGWRVIGEVYAGSEVLVDSKNWQQKSGWDHFNN